MQSVSDDDIRKRLLEKPHFELAAKGVFRLGRLGKSKPIVQIAVLSADRTLPGTVVCVYPSVCLSVCRSVMMRYLAR